MKEMSTKMGQKGIKTREKKLAARWKKKGCNTKLFHIRQNVQKRINKFLVTVMSDKLISDEVA